MARHFQPDHRNRESFIQRKLFPPSNHGDRIFLHHSYWRESHAVPNRIATCLRCEGIDIMQHNKGKPFGFNSWPNCIFLLSLAQQLLFIITHISQNKMNFFSTFSFGDKNTTHKKNNIFNTLIKLFRKLT